MKKRFKKFMALVMAATLLCSSITVFADTPKTSDSGKASGDAQMEGWVNKDVFDVVLPTVRLDGKDYNFVLDPQNLIGATSGNAYETIKDNITDTEKGLLFTNHTPASGDATGMSASSDKKEAVNKSTFDVELTLSTTVKGNTGIALVDSSDNISSGDAASMYLAIKASGDGVSGEAETSITEGSVTYTLGKAEEGAYHVIVASANATDPAKKYDYVLVDDPADSLFKKLSFYLYGECNMNPEVNWGDLTSVKPTVEVVWEMSKVGGTPAIPESDGTTAIVITYTGADPAAGSLTFTKPNGEPWQVPASRYNANEITVDATADTITLKPSWLTLAKDTFGTGTYKVTINGTAYSFKIK